MHRDKEFTERGWSLSVSLSFRSRVACRSSKHQMWGWIQFFFFLFYQIANQCLSCKAKESLGSGYVVFTRKEFTDIAHTFIFIRHSSQVLFLSFYCLFKYLFSSIHKSSRVNSQIIDLQPWLSSNGEKNAQKKLPLLWTAVCFLQSPNGVRVPEWCNRLSSARTSNISFFITLDTTST